MAGNSQRRGAVRKTNKKAAAGSGGRVKRGLEGKGPTPRAEERPYHKAYKAKQRNETEAARRPRRRAATGDSEWVAGRNSVVEALRAGVPITGVYVAEGAERDARLREAFSLVVDRGISLLEVTKRELDKMTGGAVHQGLAARVPAYEYAHPADLLDRAEEMGEKPLSLDRVLLTLEKVLEAADRGTRLGHRPAQPGGDRALGGRLRRPRRGDPRAARGRNDRVGLEDLGGCGRADPGGAGGQPGP